LPEGGATRDATARVFAMIENIDQNVGRLLGAVEELGLADDTIVVYLHDNGPQQARANAGLRGRKGEVFEGGVRSPLFVRWPGRLRPGAVDTEVGMHIDVLPTVLDLAGVAAPEDVKLDGRSLRPVLEGAPLSWPERLLVTQAHRGDRPVRGHNAAVRGARYKLVHATGFGREQPAEDTPWQLFDLTTDPGEQNDVAAQFPEVVTTMHDAYDKWFDDVSATRPDNYDPPRIVIGTDHEPVTTLTRQDWRPVHGNGWGDRGRWLLHFTNDHVYEIKVLLREPKGPARARMSIGNVRRTLQIDADTTEFAFPTIEIREGDYPLEVILDDSTGLYGPYQVVVTRY
ncbi:MAG: sulfatase-like hydrolase/transferase, partial [Planctomycetes bacterium]|nr:sulfatase-like hydrolase/transferase [Planctomycetota bacterium]